MSSTDQFNDISEFVFTHLASRQDLNNSTKEIYKLFYPEVNNKIPSDVFAAFLKEYADELTTSDLSLLSQGIFPPRFPQYGQTENTKSGLLGKSTEEIASTLETTTFDILDNLEQLLSTDSNFYGESRGIVNLIQRNLTEYTALISTSQNFRLLQPLILHEINNLMNEVSGFLTYKIDDEHLIKSIHATKNFLKILFSSYNKGPKYRLNSTEVADTLVHNNCRINIFQNVPITFMKASIIRTLMHNVIKESKNEYIDIDVHIETIDGKSRIKIVDNIGTVWPEIARTNRDLGLEMADTHGTNISLPPKGGILICSYLARLEGDEYGVELYDNDPEGAKTIAITLPNQ
jgi:hypothetical protein